MKLRLSVIALCLTSVIGMFSQIKQKLSQIYAAPPVAVINPLIVDSTNLKGDKYSEKDLLKMNLTIPEQTAFVRPLKSDTAGYFYAEKPREGYTFQLFSFYVQADRYAKLSLKITSPNMFELYVDGKLSTSKTTREENFRNEKEVTAAFNPYPLSSRVVIKLLASAEDKSSPIFKIVLENEKGDDKTTFSVQNTSKRFVNFR